MDSSFDVSQEDYVRQKGFIKDMARYLRVSAGGSRAAVMTYGKNSSLLFKFDGYATLSSFDKSVDNAPVIGGRRRLDLALIDAGLLLSEARPDNAKWVILLTAGRHPTGPGIKSLDEASNPVLERSDKVYVVAIGNEANIGQLQDVVVDPKDIFAVPSSGNLKSQSKLIARAIVEGHSKWILALLNDSTMKKTSFTVFGNSPKNTIAQSRYISVFFFFLLRAIKEREFPYPLGTCFTTNENRVLANIFHLADSSASPQN